MEENTVDAVPSNEDDISTESTSMEAKLWLFISDLLCAIAPKLAGDILYTSYAYIKYLPRIQLTSGARRL